jgi:signal transduction histidine kinase
MSCAMPSSETPSRRFRPAAPVLVVASQGGGVEPVCLVIEQTIAAMGGIYERVHGGGEALLALRRERPLLIMLALEEVFGDPDELLAGLRQRPDLDDVPVIALVPGGPGDGERAYREGASDVLPLDVSREILAAKLSAWLHLSTRAHRLWALRDFAHEARHPISAIGAGAQLLTLHDEDPAERKRLCHAIVSEAERLGRMVESYLDADAALRVGDAPFTDAPLQLIDDVLRVSMQTTQRARIDMRVHGELPALAVEPDHLRQMMINLLDNALAATALGGTVSVEALADKDGAALAIHDTGSGIAPEHLGRIFDNGFSTRGARRRGLGLGITQRLCTRALGRIVVHSQPGEGTVFGLWLPRAAPDREPEPDSEPDEAKKAANR